MFNWLWGDKPTEVKPATEAEVLLEMVKDILFPPIELQTAPDGDKYHVDHSADSNLDAALYDLEHGHNDALCQNTIRDVSNRLFDVRKLLNVTQEIDSDAKYLVVDNVKDKDL